MGVLRKNLLGVVWGAAFVASMVCRAAGSVACPGDCGEDGEVTVEELIGMVNIALGTAPVSACRAGDLNGDGTVSVDEIVSAVNNALNGCTIATTPTAGATATPSPSPAPGGGLTNPGTPFTGYDGADLEESGWNGDLVLAFTVVPYAGALCPNGGSAHCANQTAVNLTDPAMPPSGYIPGFAAFDSKGLFRGFVDKVYPPGQTPTMVYRDPDPSGTSGVGGAGSDGPLRWGAWTAGTYRLGGAVPGATLVAADSHYVIGTPVTSALGTGPVSYAPIPGSASMALQMDGLSTGGTPTLAARGTLEAFSASWDEASLSGTRLATGSVSLTVKLAGGVTFTGSTTALSALRLADLNFEPLDVGNPGQATIIAGLRVEASDGSSCTSYGADGVTVIINTCSASVRIGLVGNPATHAVLSYSINLPRGPGNVGPDRAIRGNAALKR